MLKDRHLRVARSREKSAAPKLSKYKENFSFATSLVAFVLSSLSVYATQIKHLDEVQMGAYHARFQVSHAKNGRPFVSLVDEPLQVVLTNSGNRDIAVSLILGTFNITSHSSTDCSGRTMAIYDTKFEPFVLKPQSIEVKLANLIPDKEAGPSNKALENIDLSNYDRNKKIYLNFCYALEIATIDETRDLKILIQTVEIDLINEQAKIQDWKRLLQTIYHRNSFGFF